VSRARRKDANHNAIAAELRAAGYYVVDTSRLGDGFPDLLVIGPGDYGQVMLMEVKATGGRLTPDEVLFMSTYPGPTAIVRTGQEAISAMQIMEATK
jgi:hypothetical protein